MGGMVAGGVVVDAGTAGICGWTMTQDHPSPIMNPIHTPPIFAQK